MAGIKNWTSLVLQGVFGIIVCEILFGPMLPKLLDDGLWGALLIYIIFAPGAGIMIATGVLRIMAGITGSFKEPPISHNIDEE